ncbi:MAG: ABC transporter permease [Candidatus Thermoplasmatota archaeon]|jgi:ABC-type dipeptide/oligopeptide/nickel transport system permease component|nr:ABC transporter permease [Candidatus Thermoplasmatota archaeon]
MILYFIFIIFSAIGNPNSFSTGIPTFSDSLSSYLTAFGRFVLEVLTGNWGYITATRNTPTYSGYVSTLVEIYFFSTLEVILIAALIALGISFPLGRYLGTHHTYKLAKVLRSITVIGYLTPAYVVALVLQVLLGKGVIPGNPLAVFPITGAYDFTALPAGPSKPAWLSTNGVLVTSPTHMLFFDSLIHGDYVLAFNSLEHLVLPVVTLVIGITAIVTSLLESGYTDNMGMEYVKSARSRGVSERQIAIRHVRPNAIMPVLASATIMVAFLISNVVMMEYVFAYPGIGLFLITTMQFGQYFPTAVIIFLLGLIIIFMGIAIDLLHFVKNPLIRY